jgi:hypothetical protein
MSSGQQRLPREGASGARAGPRAPGARLTDGRTGSHGQRDSSGNNDVRPHRRGAGTVAPRPKDLDSHDFRVQVDFEGGRKSSNATASFRCPGDPRTGCDRAWRQRTPREPAAPSRFVSPLAGWWARCPPASRSGLPMSAHDRHAVRWERRLGPCDPDPVCKHLQGTPPCPPAAATATRPRSDRAARTARIASMSTRATPGDASTAAARRTVQAARSRRTGVTVTDRAPNAAGAGALHLDRDARSRRRARTRGSGSRAQRRHVGCCQIPCCTFLTSDIRRHKGQPSPPSPCGSVTALGVSAGSSRGRPVGSQPLRGARERPRRITRVSVNRVRGVYRPRGRRLPWGRKATDLRSS